MAKCEICGTKIGGMLGATQADETFYKRAKAINLDLPENLCLRCAEDKVSNEESLYRENQRNKPRLELMKKLDSIFISPMPLPSNMQDCGLITGYSILGTGLLTNFTSSWTDFLGEESKSYYLKIKESEKTAINRMKLEALNINCTYIYMVRINIQEATSGHGMIMVSVFGSAARNK